MNPALPATPSLEEDISRAVETLRRGGLVVYPTDTVWGIGCDACNADAVARVYALKQRPDAKALITLVSDRRMLERYVAQLPEAAEMLLEVAVEPLTIIYDGVTGLAPNLPAPDGSAAIRIPHDNYARELARRLRRPVVSTSANVSGHPTPACFRLIEPEILSGVDYVAFHRRDDTTPARPSSIIKAGADGSIRIIR